MSAIDLVFFLTFLMINARVVSREKEKSAPCDVSLDVDGGRSMMMGSMNAWINQSGSDKNSYIDQLSSQ